MLLSCRSGATESKKTAFALVGVPSSLFWHVFVLLYALGLGALCVSNLDFSPPCLTLRIVPRDFILDMKS